MQASSCLAVAPTLPPSKGAVLEIFQSPLNGRAVKDAHFASSSIAVVIATNISDMILSFMFLKQGVYLDSAPRPVLGRDTQTRSRQGERVWLSRLKDLRTVRGKFAGGGGLHRSTAMVQTS
jgi:hypothetical protein